ncbi:MAG: ATP-dependent zinc protease family protein [Rudaea sp.]
MHDLPVIGWREWLSLPDLGLAAIKAKIDTGARSSALHVETIEEFRRDDSTWLRFTVAPRRRSERRVICEAPAVDRRRVTDSGGRIGERWFIRTRIGLAGASWEAEINLSDRRNMLFPMLLGRSALRGRFRVDPDLAYVCGRLRARQGAGVP